LEIALRIVAFLLGVATVTVALSSAIRNFVLPRSAREPVAFWVFRTMRRLFDLRARRARTYEGRDSVMALYAPISLLMLPVAWLALVLVGYMAVFWALGVRPLALAFKTSGSALLTLGFASVDDPAATAASFSEAAIGLILIALLISYLPTMYSSFSRREAAVTLLEVRAGSPPSAAEMIKRYRRIHGLDRLGDVWEAWETWFVDIEESHTSLGALAFFRSPQSHRSWVTAAGAVLDGASIVVSTVDVPHDPRADLCIRAGFLALRQVADFFDIRHDPNPRPGDPISVARQEFDALYDDLAAAGVPLKPDRDLAWRNFAGWRVNYDTVLLALAALTMAPEAPWSSDRSFLAPRRGKPRKK
jgi:hypothetical protein